MTRMISSLHLSDIQKEFLAKVKAAPNPHMAFTTVADTEGSVGQNFASARNTLEKLGIVTVANGEITINDEAVLTDEGIVDETGELTELGKQLAYIDRNEVKHQQPAQQPAGEADPMDDELPMEGLSLFRNINDKADLLEQINKFNKKSV